MSNILKSFFLTPKKVLSDNKRIVGIDYLRGCAILMVVLGHYGVLSFGWLGVNLFFAISGFVVSQSLVKEFLKSDKVNVKSFLIRRATKIWPSYYFFVLVAPFFCNIVYRKVNAHFLEIGHPSLLFRIQDLPNYLFFYVNYVRPQAWPMGHLWTISVEEHFYLILALLFLLLPAFLKKIKRNVRVFVPALFLILVGVLGKILSFPYLGRYEVTPMTHFNIDALAFGVLVYCLYELGWIEKFLNESIKVFIMIVGVALAIMAYRLFPQKNIVHFVYVFAFTLILVGSLSLRDYKWLFPLRIISYYSYNWYLWHQLLMHAVRLNVGNKYLAFIAYILITFSCAVLATKFIEERFMKIRKLFLS